MQLLHFEASVQSLGFGLTQSIVVQVKSAMRLVRAANNLVRACVMVTIKISIMFHCGSTPWQHTSCIAWNIFILHLPTDCYRALLVNKSPIRVLNSLHDNGFQNRVGISSHFECAKDTEEMFHEIAGSINIFRNGNQHTTYERC